MLFLNQYYTCCIKDIWMQKGMGSGMCVYIFRQRLCPIYLSVTYSLLAIKILKPLNTM